MGNYHSIDLLHVRIRLDVNSFDVHTMFPPIFSLALTIGSNPMPSTGVHGARGEADWASN